MVNAECNDGDVRRWVAEFTDPLNANEPADPDEVAFVWGVDGSASVTTWIYGTDAQVVRDGVGAYHADVDTTGSAPIGDKAYITGQFFGNADGGGSLQVSGYAVLLVMGNPVTNPFET